MRKKRKREQDDHKDGNGGGGGGRKRKRVRRSKGKITNSEKIEEIRRQLAKENEVGPNDLEDYDSLQSIKEHVVNFKDPSIALPLGVSIFFNEMLEKQQVFGLCKKQPQRTKRKRKTKKVQSRKKFCTSEDDNNTEDEDESGTDEDDDDDDDEEEEEEQTKVKLTKEEIVASISSFYPFILK
jgi:hypothetical protein